MTTSWTTYSLSIRYMIHFRYCMLNAVHRATFAFLVADSPGRNLSTNTLMMIKNSPLNPHQLSINLQRYDILVTVSIIHNWYAKQLHDSQHVISSCWFHLSLSWECYENNLCESYLLIKQAIYIPSKGFVFVRSLQSHILLLPEDTTCVVLRYRLEI